MFIKKCIRVSYEQYINNITSYLHYRTFRDILHGVEII